MTETTALALLPSNSNKAEWSPQQRALMDSLGLRGEKNVRRGETWTKEAYEAPTAIVEAFIYQINRTQLDPVARQIYCIERGGKWGIQVSIDGFRLIAERSGEYRGQTPAQWTDGKVVNVPLREDGKVVRDGAGNPILVEDYRWVDAWVSKEPPAAARVGIYRDGFAEPMWGVATYDGYVARDRNGKPTGQWESNSANQLAKCAEMLGLRKAFPQELSGLYGTEEMDQASNPRGSAPAAAQRPAAAVSSPVQDDRDWKAEIEAVDSVAALTALANEAQSAGALGVRIGLAGDNDDGSAHTVWDVLVARKAELQPSAPEPLPGTETKAAKPRQWVREARTKESRAEVRALLNEAEAAGVEGMVLDELAEIMESLPVEAEAAADEPWAPVASDDALDAVADAAAAEETAEASP